MKPIPDCVPDALAMIIATAKAVSDDDFIHSKVLLKVLAELADQGEFGPHPADVYLDCWEIACRALGVKDPYENEKARGDKTALGILKYLADQNPECCAEVPLPQAIRISLSGAMLDYNALGRVDMQDNLMDHFGATPARDDSEALVEAVTKAESVMLVANRAGEIALDKPLCEAVAAMGKKMYLSVAAKPVFSLATERDAENISISPQVTVVNPGTAMYGLLPDRTSSEFRALLGEVGVVIAKGSTNFSTMTPGSREIFFILNASQPEVAAELGIQPGTGAIAKITP